MKLKHIIFLLVACASATSFAQTFTTLGVGTNNPAGTLHVNSSVLDEPDMGITPLSLSLDHYKSSIYLTNACGGTTQNDGFKIVLYDDELTMRHQEIGNFHIFGYNGAGITIATNGYVGIGTTNPTKKLHVSGSTLIDGSAELRGNVTIGSGCAKISIGSAHNEDLAWGSAYIGLNAVRSGSTWHSETGGSLNGGAVIWATTKGDILFANIRSNDNGDRRQSYNDNFVRSNANMRLSAEGTLYAKEVVVTLENWPDYVFDKNHEVATLTETEQYIKANGHLPGVPSAKEVESDGISLGEMNKILLQKIEELTLQVIDLQHQITQMKGE